MTNWFVFSCLWLGFMSAMVSGVFQSFSDFVMAGLNRARIPGGIESMQHINRTVYRSVFLTAFLALVPLTTGFAIFVALYTTGLSKILAIAAAVVYVAAVFLVTAARNVPMNRRLDAMDADSQEAASYWLTYYNEWTRWNHVRTLGSAATAVLYLIAAATFDAPA